MHQRMSEEGRLSLRTELDDSIGALTHLVELVARVALWCLRGRGRPMAGGLRDSIFEASWKAALLAGCAFAKILFVTQGDITQALGVIKAVGPVNVVIGAALSLIPILSDALVAVFIYLAFRCGLSSASEKMHTGKLLYRTIIGVGLIAAFFLTPWPAFVATLLIAALTGAVDRWRSGRSSELPNPSRAVLIAGVVGLLVWSFVSGNELLTQVWVPHEVIEVSAKYATDDCTTPESASAVGEIRLQGYVLSTGDGWLTLLCSGSRHLMVFEASEVKRRTVCRLTRKGGAGHLHESSFQLIWRHFSTGAQLCDMLHPDNVRG